MFCSTNADELCRVSKVITQAPAQQVARVSMVCAPRNAAESCPARKIFRDFAFFIFLFSLFFLIFYVSCFSPFFVSIFSFLLFSFFSFFFRLLFSSPFLQFFEVFFIFLFRFSLFVSFLGCSKSVFFFLAQTASHSFEASLPFSYFSFFSFSHFSMYFLLSLCSTLIHLARCTSVMLPLTSFQSCLLLLAASTFVLLCDPSPAALTPIPLCPNNERRRSHRPDFPKVCLTLGRRASFLLSFSFSSSSLLTVTRFAMLFHHLLFQRFTFFFFSFHFSSSSSSSSTSLPLAFPQLATSSPDGCCPQRCFGHHPGCLFQRC